MAIPGRMSVTYNGGPKLSLRLATAVKVYTCLERRPFHMASRSRKQPREVLKVNSSQTEADLQRKTRQLNGRSGTLYRNLTSLYCVVLSSYLLQVSAFCLTVLGSAEAYKSTKFQD